MNEKQKQDRDRVVELVESHLKSEGLELDKVRKPSKDGHPYWAFAQGSAAVRVHLIPGPEERGINYFQVVSPVLIVPEQNRESLFQELLELNADQLWMCAFALRGDTVLLTADRTTVDLDKSEVIEMIERVAAYADRLDDELANKFGATRFADRKSAKPKEG
jgi:hypothetical protein